MKHRAPDDRSETTEADSEEGFLGRWSRLKETARDADKQSPVAVTSDATVPDEARPVDKPEEKVLTDADMPAIETLDAESDFSPFMSPGVSEKLRQLALRKLFKMPYFNIRDGLDDYDDDFTIFEPLGDTVTADMKHRQEVREARERAEREAELARRQPEASEPVAQADGEAETQVHTEADDSAQAEPADEDADQRSRARGKTGDQSARATPDGPADNPANNNES